MIDLETLLSGFFFFLYPLQCSFPPPHIVYYRIFSSIDVIVDIYFLDFCNDNASQQIQIFMAYNYKHLYFSLMGTYSV